ncbi:MAG: hypothetical protein GC139_01485 [Sideroxydans sp.]|nr:hypothetical protein [Sideroxydans sp.]
MLRLDKARLAWGMPEFEAVLKQELARQAALLPLQQGLSSSSYVVDTPITVVINRVTDLGNAIHVRAGIFYQGVIGGCSCADDPSPVSEIDEYCEVLLEIDKETAATAVALVMDAAG